MTRTRFRGLAPSTVTAALAAMAVCLLLVLPESVLAADPQFATVMRLRGEVKASGSSGERPLREGDSVFVGDKVVAAATSEAVLKTLDAGMVAVRPGAEFIVQGFTARGDNKDGMALRLLTGSLRVISGWIGRSNRDGHKIITPSATIGIRGTDHEPFVLTKDVPAVGSATPHRAGTYDKVNRGGTTLAASGQVLEIDPGRVGFARADSKAFRSRALMTLLLPVLLDKIPEFYVPGEFDGELDRYSQVADAVAQQELAQKLGAPVSPAPETPPATPVAPPAVLPAVPPTVTPPATPAPAPAAPVAPVAVDCDPAKVAQAWLKTLDDAISRKDANTILGQFAQDVGIKAVVRKKDGSLADVEFSRDELVRSTLATVAQLEGYQHRRVTVEARPGLALKGPGCARVLVKSVVIEQGRLAGKPYRFESSERYVLELRGGVWLAISAESTQR